MTTFNKALLGGALGLALLVPASGLAAAKPAAAGGATYAALDPRGTYPAVPRIPLTKRLASLEGKRIYIIMSWDKESGFDQAALDLAAALKAKGAIPVTTGRNVRYSEDDPQLWAKMKADKADGFIYVPAASSSTTSYAYKWSSHLEAMGFPGSVVSFDQLASVGVTTMEREGAPLRHTSFSYPTQAMDKARYQAALDKTITDLTGALTAAETRTGVITPTAPPKIAAVGNLDQVQKTFYDKGLTDGLPIIPPTEAKVAAMLKGTHHAPDEVVAKAFYPEGLTVTVRQVAINAVMAGCDPEDLPVVLAAVEAFQKNNLNSMLRSTNSFAFMQVVNGPIAKQLKMNGGFNAVGPGNHANAVIGRTMRMMIINLGGGAPGVNIMAVIGNNANYSFAFSENEDQSPWEPLNVSQGFKKTDNTLTLFSGGWAHLGNYNLGSKFDEVFKDISRFEIKTGATIIVSPQRAEDLKRQGMSKKDAEEYLWKNAAKTLGELRHERFFSETPAMKAMPDSTVVQIFPKGSIRIVVAGGDASPMMQSWSMYRPTTISIDKWK